MKAKNLKSYNSYEKEHIKEHFMSIPICSNVTKFNNSDENLEDIITSDEEIITPSIETTYNGLGTEEEKKIDMPIFTHIEIASDNENLIEPETLPISEPVNTKNFDPKKDNDITQTIPTTIQNCISQTQPQTSNAKIFSIVKIMSQNGEKIGMCYTDEVGEYGTPIHNHLDFNVACELVKQCCKENCVEEFNNENDIIVGMIPSFMLSKKNKGLGGASSTSYIPN
jgi:hypothetical protein